MKKQPGDTEVKKEPYRQPEFMTREQHDIGLLNKEIGFTYQILNRIESKLESIDKRFDSIDKKFEAMDKKFEAKFDKLSEKVDSRFLWTLSAIGTLTLTVVGFILTFHQAIIK